MDVKKTDPIAEGLVAGIYYTLTDDDGNVLDSNRKAGHGPMAFLCGSGNIVPGLEKALIGRVKGDRINADVPPEEGYGTHDEKLVQRQPLSAMPPDIEIEVGQRLRGVDAKGQPKQATIVAIEDGEVVLDENHPLAGETLHFEVEIVGVRAATPEERQHRHAHGKGGHAH